MAIWSERLVAGSFTPIENALHPDVEETDQDDQDIGHHFLEFVLDIGGDELHLQGEHRSNFHSLYLLGGG